MIYRFNIITLLPMKPPSPHFSGIFYPDITHILAYFKVAPNQENFQLIPIGNQMLWKYLFLIANSKIKILWLLNFGYYSLFQKWRPFWGLTFLTNHMFLDLTLCWCSKFEALGAKTFHFREYFSTLWCGAQRGANLFLEFLSRIFIISFNN